jgi:hypothetical protein
MRRVAFVTAESASLLRMGCSMLEDVRFHDLLKPVSLLLSIHSSGRGKMEVGGGDGARSWTEA